jgi:hypothetical protein
MIDFPKRGEAGIVDWNPANSDGIGTLPFTFPRGRFPNRMWQA